MKWYWIVLIVIAVSAVVYFVYKKMNQQSIACRAGTCPFIRDDGSVFCTAAACSKNEKTVVTEEVVPNNRTIVLLKAPRNVPSNNNGTLYTGVK